MKVFKDYTFQREALRSVKEDITTLLQDHWQEVELDQERIALEPDWESYKQIEQNGNLGIFTCRLDEELIGYLVVFASTNPHHKSHIFAITDLIYLKPEHRKGRLAQEMIQFVEDQLRELGVSVFTLNMKTRHPFDNLMTRLDFTFTEKVYSKCLLKGTN